jgi:hypothetical protein
METNSIGSGEHDVKGEEEVFGSFAFYSPMKSLSRCAAFVNADFNITFLAAGNELARGKSSKKSISDLNEKYKAQQKMRGPDYAVVSARSFAPQ